MFDMGLQCYTVCIPTPRRRFEMQCRCVLGLIRALHRSNYVPDGATTARISCITLRGVTAVQVHSCVSGRDGTVHFE